MASLGSSVSYSLLHGTARIRLNNKPNERRFLRCMCSLSFALTAISSPPDPPSEELNRVANPSRRTKAAFMPASRVNADRSDGLHASGKGWYRRTGYLQRISSMSCAQNATLVELQNYADHLSVAVVGELERVRWLSRRVAQQPILYAGEPSLQQRLHSIGCRVVRF